MSLASDRWHSDHETQRVVTARPTFKGKSSKCDSYGIDKEPGKDGEQAWRESNPNAVEAVLTCKTLKTDKQLMSFLGIANCYGEIIK